jgi:hypothetical protein
MATGKRPKVKRTQTERLKAIQPVDPNLVYTPDTLARTLGLSKRWIMDHLVSNDAIDVRREGDFIGIPCWVFVRWVEAEVKPYHAWPQKEGRPRVSPPTEGSDQG